jgi:hypothetical protein
MACLGLITSKTPELENKEEVIERIKEAAKIVPLERLCLSAQCGFASTHHGTDSLIYCRLTHKGNPLTEEAQWAKVRLITEVSGPLILYLLIQIDCQGSLAGLLITLHDDSKVCCHLTCFLGRD